MTALPGGGPHRTPPDGGPRRTPPSGVAPAFARSVRFWARAYPRRWRAVRGEELLGLLADLAAPGARRLDARSALDLVRAGWMTRLREHPPLGPWARYRFLGQRSLAEYRGWVADDIDGLLFHARQLMFLVAVFGVADVVQLWAGSAGVLEAWFWAWLAVVVATDDLLLGGHIRANARETHLVPRRGERVTPGSWVRVRSPRRRVAATVGLPWAATAATVTFVLSVAATVVAPTTMSFTWLDHGEGLGFGADSGGAVPRAALLALLAAALGAGLVLAGLARRRLTDVETAVGQPEREVVTLGARLAAGIIAGTVVVGAVPVAEALGAIPPLLGLGLGLVAAVVAPSAVVAWLVVRRRRELHGLAYVDVRRVALRGRPPEVDPPGSCLSPARPSEIGELWPWSWNNEDPRTALG